MKCRSCKYNGFLTDEDGKPYSWCDELLDNLDVDEERWCACYVPATHADQIRAMTDEELEEFMSDDLCELLECPVCDGHCDEKLVKWLKEELKE